ncbi:hypothetical protein AB0N62_34760 [Streptomyces sp. NPDC093982]|uniref:hypothetical protein n=1 Tax=Streptomyces sp. NPDC093982 TaxID=3155077 RepID=UPI00343F8A87
MADTENTEQPGRLSVISTAGGVRVLTLSGGIDHHAGGSLRQAVNAADAGDPVS